MTQKFVSPIEQLTAEGKAVSVPETEARLIAHLQRTYVPAMIKYGRRQRRLAFKIVGKPLR